MNISANRIFAWEILPGKAAADDNFFRAVQPVVGREETSLQQGNLQRAEIPRIGSAHESVGQ